MLIYYWYFLFYDGNISFGRLLFMMRTPVSDTYNQKSMVCAKNNGKIDIN